MSSRLILTDFLSGRMPDNPERYYIQHTRETLEFNLALIYCGNYTRGIRM